MNSETISERLGLLGAQACESYVSRLNLALEDVGFHVDRALLQRCVQMTTRWNPPKPNSEDDGLVHFRPVISVPGDIRVIPGFKDVVEFFDCLDRRHEAITDPEPQELGFLTYVIGDDARTPAETGCWLKAEVQRFREAGYGNLLDLG
ncbi:MAG: hypothetical protein ABIJ72_02880 [bacterium]